MAAKGTSIAGTLEYLLERMFCQDDGCWVWTSTKSRDGYGKAVMGYKGNGRPIRKLAHRVYYEMLVGPVPEGLELDHLCRNRLCFRPDHLEPVTRKENVRRGLLPTLMKDRSFNRGRPRLPECRRGHKMELSAPGRQVCKTCKRNNESARQERQKNGT